MTASDRLLVDAILFDSDGVLVDSHEQVEAAWQSVAAQHGLPWDRLRDELVGVPARQTLARHLDGAQLDEAVELLEHLEVETAATTRPVRGAVELTSSLPRDSYAIVTSATRRLGMARWAGAGVIVPDVVITADDVTRGKPDPEPFLAAARRLGIDPARCLVFEDSDAGGRAARAAGAFVIAVGGSDWTTEPWRRVLDLTGVTVTRVAAGLEVALPADATPGGIASA